MAVQQITRHTVQTGIKYGMTSDDFCSKYQCSSGEFEQSVNLLFRRNATDIFNRLRDNSRKKSRNGSTNPRSTSNDLDFSASDELDPLADSDFESPTNDDFDLPCSISDDSELIDDGSDCTSDKVTPISRDEQLAQLQKLELIQSDGIIALESQHKTLARQHRERIKRLREINDALNQLQYEFQAKASEYEAIVTENNDLVSQMNQISAQRAEKVALLAQTRETIATLTAVTVCAYENGEIAFLNETDSVHTLDESGSDELFCQMRTQELYDDLRGKDIRLLARMLSIIKNAQVRIEPVFENEELDAFFHTMST